MPRLKQDLMPVKPKVEFTPQRKARFLEHLRETGFQQLSAERVGVTARCVQDHVTRDKEFATAYEEALNHHTENVLVRAAIERGVKGVKRAIIGGKDRDEIVCHEQVYSDALLQTLLKARKVEYNKGAGADGEGGGAAGGRVGGVLLVAQAPHSMEDWHRLFGEKAKGQTGAQS